MIVIPGYAIQNLLHESSRTRVYRVHRENDGAPVIAKVLRAEFPSLRDLGRFQLGHDIGRSIESDHVIGHLGVVPITNGLAVLTEDYGAISLDRLRIRDRSTRAVLQIAIAIVRGLADVHRNRVIHKDIKPANIVMNPHTGRVKIIDFGIATRLERESPALNSPENIEGSLAYISPEQTGRMNRNIDPRSDFYSLGITLYELFSGDLPFRSDDPMELIHCHLARPTPRLSSPDREIPPVLADIIGKLTAKTAEERYQSAHGILHDLQWCLDHLASDPDQADFVIGSRDVSDRFQLPQAIYGRDIEIRQLLGSFHRAGSGGRVLLAVSGYSGIGKSALIHEVHKPIVEHCGWFCSGKFDQFRRDLPYQALIDALRDLVRQLLAKDETILDWYRAGLEKALGSYGRIVAGVIPELERLLGPQPPVQSLSALEAQNRFNGVFTRFISVFARSSHPLTLFLDDLQWADLPSLSLLTAMMTDPELSHLLIIGAYRDNEVSETHPLAAAMERIREAGQEIERIHLPPLDEISVLRFVADATLSDRERAAPLARLIKEKTDGNPFFVGEFLRTLHARELIAFDTVTARWNWDVDAIGRLDITNNVVDLLASKLKDLPADVLEILQLASCIGNRFDLRTLAMVLGRDLEQTAQHLDVTLASGFILPLDDSYKYMKALARMDRTLVAGSDAENAWYRFLHDRVQQAASSLLGDEERRHRHLRIGRVLLEQTPPSRRDEILIDIANHFDQARDLLSGPAERLGVARLQLDAGRRAKASLAFAPAAHYLEAARALLPGDAWAGEYHLTLTIHVECADLLQLCGEYRQADRIIGTILENARTLLDAVPAHRIRVEARIAQQDHNGALDIAVVVLRKLGLDLPRAPTRLQILQELARTKWIIGRRNPADLVDLPAMTDPGLLAIMDILRANASSAYFTDADLFVMIILKTVQVAVRHGNSAQAANGYALYAIFLCGALRDIEGGYAFGRLGFQVLERHPSSSLAGKMSFIWGAFVAPWKDRFTDCARLLFDGWRPAVDGGDLEYAAYAILHSYILSVLAGQSLDATHERYRDHVEWVRTSRQAQSVVLMDCWSQLVLHLRDGERVNARLAGENFDMDARLPGLVDRDDQIAIAYASVAEGILACLVGDHERARSALDRADRHGDQLFSSILIPAVRFYSAITDCALVQAARGGRSATAEGRVRKALDEVDRCAKLLRTWARFNPGAFQHKVTLVAAERARLLGRLDEADLRYRQSVAEAAASGFLQDEALANELRAGCWLERGEPDVARIFMARARHLYQQWGAATKVLEIDRTHGDLLLPPPEDESMARSRQTTAADHGRSTSDHAAAWLELTTIIRASQAISAETTLTGALRILLAVILENCGAGRGYLVGGDSGGFTVEAHASGGSVVEVPEKPRPADPDELSLDIVRYVARSRNEVVLDDAGADDAFGSDSYVRRHLPRSLLCLPLVKQDALVGVLYLENNLAPGAFTPATLDTVRVLAAQAAITLENARLFQQQAETGERLRGSLKEKEILLREVHHRVKNNLQVISSLLALQSKRIVDPEVRLAFQESRGRIHSMALIHENLYSDGSTGFDRVEIRSYLARLIREIRRSQIGEFPRVDIRNQVEDLVLPLELAVPCGLIVNELLTNALKYAFPDDRRGVITLGSEREDAGWVTLVVADDGVGMDPGVDPERAETLGLKLVTTLSRQLRGRVELVTGAGAGTTARISFPVPDAPVAPGRPPA